GGCAVGPRYVKPTTNLAPFHNLAGASATKPEFSAPPLDSWWTGFGDPMLVTVVQRALDQNLDLAAAFARVRQPRPPPAPPGRGTSANSRFGGDGHSRAPERCESVWCCCEWFSRLQTRSTRVYGWSRGELGNRSFRRAAARCSCGC